MKQYGIFDMDGLLVDSENVFRVVFEEMARERGLEVDPQFFHEVCGTCGDYELAIIHRYYPTLNPPVFWQEWHNRGMERMKTQIDLKPGVVEILSYLKGQGLKLAVASSSGLEVIRHHLEVGGISRYFDLLVSGEQVEHCKPEPDVFLLAAKELGADPRDCYVFEDSLQGGWAGVKAGCTTVLVPDQVPPTPELKEAVAAVCPTLNHALKLIREGTL